MAARRARGRAWRCGTAVTDRNRLSIRAADARDAEILVAMIAELATEESIPGEMVATAADLAEAMNQPHPACNFLIADWDGRAAGYCASYPGFSTFIGRATISSHIMAGSITSAVAASTVRGRQIGCRAPREFKIVKEHRPRTE